MLKRKTAKRANFGKNHTEGLHLLTQSMTEPPPNHLTPYSETSKYGSEGENEI